MAKISIKRPRIISKKFPEVNSTIDGVEKSLNDLVFSYSEHIDRTLQKKHIMMAVSSMVLLIVLGSFISPKGKAESSVFYPDTCLGGWINPQYAQGEQDTTSNGDESQFTKHNSAVLPKNTNAEMYCGNFKGKFDQETKPTKIIVSLALTKGSDLLLEDTIESGLVATSSVSAIPSASSSDLILASSTLEMGSSTIPTESSTTTSSFSSSTEASAVATSSGSAIPSEPVNSIVVASATPSNPIQETTSAVTNVIDSLKESIINLFENNKDSTPVTDTVIVPPAPVEQAPAPAPAPAPEPAATPVPESAPSPTSLLDSSVLNLLSLFSKNIFEKVYAEEIATSSESLPTSIEEVVEGGAQETLPVVLPVEPVTTQEVTQVATSLPDIMQEATTTSFIIASSTEVFVGSSSFILASTTDSTVSSGTIASPSEIAPEADNQFQNNFLEVFYTFDGVTWVSLGELNEISMKYRTFEIPVSASTSWNDLAQLQVKVVAKRHTEETPTVYLDSIKVEVLYETLISHAHPDFARDTILKDEIVDGIRIVTIVNHETKEEEVWYMVLEEIAATSTMTTASSTTATSTDFTHSTSTQEVAVASSSSTEVSFASSTVEDVSTSTQKVAFDLLAKKWKKFESSVVPEDVVVLVEAIKKQEIGEKKDTDISASSTEEVPPDFAFDIIKKIKGTFLNLAIVQLQKDGGEELWVYDLEKGIQEKIQTSTSTVLSANSPLGVKDGYIFWLSEDRKQIFVYNILTKELQTKDVPPHDITQGERAEVVFDLIPWTVIIGADSFSFFSKETGEVFSDDNGSIAEILRQKFKLDSLLNKEELSNLNFQVEEGAANPAE